METKSFHQEHRTKRDESKAKDRQDRALQEAETKANSNEDDTSAEPDQKNRVDRAVHRPMEKGREKFAKVLTLGLSPVLPSR
jgi:uncharacterized membrane protein YdbT with pleckstrin-like domain